MAFTKSSSNTRKGAFSGVEHVPSALENALSRLQCVLLARRLRYTPESVSWAQYDVLEVLRLNGPMTPSALSDKLGVTRPTLSKTLRVLKDLALVAQAQTNDDRREQTTSLSDLGRDFLMRAASGRRDAAEKVMIALTPGEQAIFIELCQKTSEALDYCDSRL